MIAVAQGDVNLQAGVADSNWSEGRQHSSRSLLGSKSKTTRASLEETQAVSSTFSGNTVAVQGRNVTVTGSNVVSDAGTTIVARNDLTIQAATETASQSQFKETRTSGVFSGGGIESPWASRCRAMMRRPFALALHPARWLVCRVMSLVAGNQYRQIGSDVLAPVGDILVTAKNIEISEARQTSQFERESRFRQSGLSVSISSPIVSAIESTGRIAKATRDTDNDRMKALGVAMVALNVADAYEAGSNIADAVSNGGDIAKAAGVGINISWGPPKAKAGPFRPAMLRRVLCSRLAAT